MPWHWDKTVRRIADGKPQPIEPDNRALIALACFVLAAAIVAGLVLRDLGGAMASRAEVQERSLTWLVCASGASVGVGIGVAMLVWFVGRGAARDALDWALDRFIRGRPH